MDAASSIGLDQQLVIAMRIEEGIGLNSVEHVLIQSTLSGNQLRSEPVRPGHTTSFDCNLIWETDKKSIKR